MTTTNNNIVFPPIPFPVIPVTTPMEGGRSPSGLIQPVCEICFHICKLPVKLTCFPCYRPSKLHCHSIKRFCYTCARTFLEMDRPRLERSTAKKCTYCDSTVDLQMLRANECFEKDFFIMSLDTTQHSCVHAGCEFKGTQNDLNRHLGTCEFIPRRCRGCGLFMLDKEMEAHTSNCSGRQQCPECRLYILETQFHRHLLQEHSVKQCEYCDVIVAENDLEEHLQFDCSYEPIECDFCTAVYSSGDEVQHLCDHLNEFQSKEVQLLYQSHELKSQCQKIRQRIAQL